VWLQCATAWAQQEAADEGGKSYVLAYVLVGFVVALAMMVVCRGTNRRDKPKMVEADLKHQLEQLQGKK
jgi:predicted Co/Zn/Cd cation transporter (cation efflux family)